MTMAKIININKNKAATKVTVYARPFDRKRMSLSEKALVGFVFTFALIGVALWLPFYFISRLWKRITRKN